MVLGPRREVPPTSCLVPRASCLTLLVVGFASPDNRPDGLIPGHGIARFAAESCRELRQVGDRSVGSPAPRRVRVRIDAHALPLRSRPTAGESRLRETIYAIVGATVSSSRASLCCHGSSARRTCRRRTSPAQRGSCRCARTGSRTRARLPARLFAVHG